MKSTTVFKKIFQDHWDIFKQKHSAYNDEFYNQAVEKMLGCGDVNNGYIEYRCTICGLDVKYIPFTCKSTFCLSCGKVYADSVVSQVSRMLHPGVTYRHIVLTVPQQLRQIFNNNRKNKTLYAALMKTAYQCLQEVVSVARKKIVKIGAIVVIHTHGRSGSYNPHAHIIMTDGGITQEQEEWVNFGYFPYETIHKKWQYHLLSMLKKQFGYSIYKQIDLLWKQYPQGFVGHVAKEKLQSTQKGWQNTLQNMWHHRQYP